MPWGLFYFPDAEEKEGRKLYQIGRLELLTGENGVGVATMLVNPLIHRRIVHWVVVVSNVGV